MLDKSTKGEEKICNIWWPTNHYFGTKTCIGEVKTLIDNTTGQRSLFLDSRFFFNSTQIFFSTQISKFRLMFFFSFVNIYFANVEYFFFYCIRCIFTIQGQSRAVKSHLFTSVSHFHSIFKEALSLLSSFPLLRSPLTCCKS